MTEHRLNYRQTFLLGFGFFIISMSWSLFNSYIPIFLKRFISSTALVGAVMTLDNIAGLTIQPFFSAWSDRTVTRFGRRLPFLLIGLPLAAVFFVLLPKAGALWTLLAGIVLFDLAMSIFRGPTIALMPDLTPSPLRSKANGVINLMGGLGAVLAFTLGSLLYRANPVYPFILTSILMLGILVLLPRVIREPAAGEREERVGVFQALLEVARGDNKSGLFLLVAIFFWFVGWNGAETFFTTYGKYGLGIKESTASFMLSFFSIAFLIFSVPSGLLATRVGRRKTILAGIAGLSLIFLALFAARQLTVIGVFLFIGGICWALININSYPMVVEMAGPGKVGAYTGLYYFFASLAAVVAPPLFGLLMDLFGYAFLFVVSFVSMSVAGLMMLRVTTGEAAR